MLRIKNKEDLQTIIDSGNPALFDFYTDWCGPCRNLLPIIEKLATKHKDDFAIAKVNVDENHELAQQFGVKSIPALFFIKDGEVQENLMGMQSEIVLEEKIQSYL